MDWFELLRGAGFAALGFDGALRDGFTFGVFGCGDDFCTRGAFFGDGRFWGAGFETLGEGRFGAGFETFGFGRVGDLCTFGDFGRGGVGATFTSRVG